MPSNLKRRRVRLALVACLAAVGLSGCAGVLDWCGDGLNPPAGGWDSHGPG